ncbi:hypothetical protein [Paraglaciecola sp. MB-3u-78]|jgi:hypothetical protein|uniref:hypothetical protein n=1 Tax=Paraglaciecola sp. MB-3u-78 TaxID=2058332 RepID=UPI000C32EF8B|nr:hypothetical protein [Paraglaciecola sp. MB-3u-78]PKG96765.1 hypothetical protein CXF95_23430 [Paraglaciecola sp. MB-3u-78]
MLKGYILLLIFLSFGAQAGCSISDEMREQNNFKYAGEISIDVRLIEQNYSVLISAPKTLNSEPFVGFHLVGDSFENPVFAAPLASFEEDDKFKTWFVIDAGLIRKHLVITSFGEDCGFDVTKEVVYQ